MSVPRPSVRRGAESGYGGHEVRELRACSGCSWTRLPVFRWAVYPVDALLGGERYLFISQLRLDTAFDVAAVTVECAWAHSTLLVLRQPAVQPFAQGHPAVLGQLHIPIAVDVLMKLVQQFFLCFGVDVTEDGLAVFSCGLPRCGPPNGHRLACVPCRHRTVFVLPCDSPSWIDFLFHNTNNYHTF